MYMTYLPEPGSHVTPCTYLSGWVFPSRYWLGLVFTECSGQRGLYGCMLHKILPPGSLNLTCTRGVMRGASQRQGRGLWWARRAVLGRCSSYRDVLLLWGVSSACWLAG